MTGLDTIGLDGQRVYLDWNATAPLRPEARQAMLDAMDQVGNPSSVHAEGRAAKKIVETARGQLARLIGCDTSEVVFTSGATESAALLHPALSHNAAEIEPILLENPSLNYVSEASHEALIAHRYVVERKLDGFGGDTLAVNLAEGETGLIQKPRRSRDGGWRLDGEGPAAWLVVDVTQLLGKQGFDFSGSRAQFALCSAHKIGGPKGSGAIIVRAGYEFRPFIKGGGQEQGRRSGTENVIGIAGFGAAAEAAQRDLEDGVWDRVEKLRNILEERLESAAPDLIIFGKEAPRLPNTSCFAIPGWKGETQVMQMDLSGFAVSAGSACSSGKVNKASRVLLAMGFDDITASSAIRVSMGPTTTEAEVMAFAYAWTEHYRRRKARAA